MEQEVKGITTRLIVEYVRKAGGEGAVHELIAQAGEGLDEGCLCDERGCASFEQKIRLFEAAKHILGDPEVPFRVGQSVIQNEAGSALKMGLKMQKNPSAALAAVPGICRKFSDVTSMEMVKSNGSEGVLRYYVEPPVTPHLSDCDYNRGLLSAIPMLFGRAPAEVEHTVCAVRGDAPYCEYKVSWQSGWIPNWMLTFLGSTVGLLVYTASCYPEPLRPDLGLLIQPLLGAASGLGLGYIIDDRKRRAAGTEMMRKQNALLTKINDQLINDLETAYQVQKSLLPKAPPKISGLDVAGRLFYARRIGGDFYDYIAKGDRLGVCVADVCGKGVQAALFTSVLKNAMWQSMYTSNRPKKLLAYIDQQVNRQLPEEMFITMACAVADVARNRVVISSAGHEPVIFYRAAEKRARLLEIKGVALGLRPLAGISQDLLHEEDYEFAEGDILMFYTDGALLRHESPDESRKRLCRILEETADKPADVIVNTAFTQLMTQSSGSKRDDLTLVVVKRTER